MFVLAQVSSRKTKRPAACQAGWPAIGPSQLQVQQVASMDARHIGVGRNHLPVIAPPPSPRRPEQFIVDGALETLKM